MDLANKKCIPCKAGTPPMPDQEARKLLQKVPGWQMEDKKITREFQFDDFKRSMKFVNLVAEIAESEGHHPDIYIFYSQVKLTLWTHAAGGLTENDFVMAAKINQI